MKKIFLLIFLVFPLVCIAQDRVNEEPASLSWKSKEINKAYFWIKESKTGKWKSRKNNKLVYLWEGVKVDNFNSIFIGEYNKNKYLFLDYRKYDWRYPNLKMEWRWWRYIFAALISENDYNMMESLEVGDTLVVRSIYHNYMYKGDVEYSFPLFLKMTNALYSSSLTLYNLDKKEHGDNYAKSKWREDNPLIQLIVLKRVVDSKGQDLVRFTIYPSALEDLIDISYFEIEYKTYRNLFTLDKTNKYE